MADDNLPLPPPEWEAKRRCRKCWVAKPLDEFERKGAARNRGNICKDCRNAMQRDAYATKPERKAYLDRWIAHNPEKRKSYAAADYARLRADLKRSLAKTLGTTRATCKRRGIEMTITADTIFGIYGLQQGACALTGRTLIWGAQGIKRDSISIDRIEPALGYVPDNVRLITYQANFARNSFSDDELFAFCEAVLATRGVRP